MADLVIQEDQKEIPHPLKVADDEEDGDRLLLALLPPLPHAFP
jgi:hypothetical protein